MKTYLVVNPQSANGQTGRSWPQLAAQVNRVLGEVGHGFTRGPMDAARLAREAVANGHRCIVAVGGDGTLNEVVNGLFENGQPLDPALSIGVIAQGTGGDFRKTFSWDLNVESALRRIHSGQSRPFDVGQLEYTAHDGSTKTRYFANICSFGVSGLVDQEVNRTSKRLGGKLSFMVGSVRAMLKYQDRDVEVRVDGGNPERLRVTTLAVANGRYFGGGMCVAPEADTADGLFDVTVWSGYTLKDFALKSRALYDGSHVRFPGTRTLRCKSIEARPVRNEEVLLDVDGEQPGRLPCKMTVIPGALRLKV